MDVSTESGGISGVNYENTDKFMSVRDVNWDDTEIRRSGVIPIYDDGINKWIGLGISRYSANITPIGGEFECSDHDLISTAVREYNEEVGSNMPNITDDSVLNCYAIKSNRTIQILLPVNRYPDNFIPTNELNSMLWVTPKQLIIFSDNQQYLLPSKNHETSKGFSFAVVLHDISKLVAAVVSSGIPFNRISSPLSLVRPERKKEKSSQSLSTSKYKFKADAQSPGKWHISALTIGDNYFGIMHSNRTLYLFPIIDLDEVLSIANKYLGNSKIYVSSIADRENLVKNNKLHRRTLSSIEYGYIKFLCTDNGSELNMSLQKFIGELHDIRQQSEIQMIMNECSLILQSETLIYDFISKTGVVFNTRRGYFLRGINMVNRFLSRNTRGITYRYLKQSLHKEMVCDEITASFIINQMLAIGLLEQNHQTTELKIPI
jgi:hypothetical protein